MKSALAKGRPSAAALAAGGLVAALYVGLTAVFAPISFGPVQFRVAEMLTLLPVLSSVSVPGLFLGCFLSNLIFGAPWQDVIFGSLATLAAAYLTRLFRKDLWLAALMPVLVNGLAVGSTLALVYGLPWLATMGFVALGEAGVCYVLGVPMLRLLEKRFGDQIGRF
jgi:uncharacterized membrane protein